MVFDGIDVVCCWVCLVLLEGMLVVVVIFLVVICWLILCLFVFWVLYFDIQFCVIYVYYGYEIDFILMDVVFMFVDVQFVGEGILFQFFLFGCSMLVVSCVLVGFGLIEVLVEWFLELGFLYDIDFFGWKIWFVCVGLLVLMCLLGSIFEDFNLLCVVVLVG